MTQQKKLPNRKSEDVMGLSIYLSRKINPIKAAQLISIFNQIVSKAVYPRCLKTAKTVSIFKEGDNSPQCNNRPNSVVSVMRKIFEKRLTKQIINFFNKFDVLSFKRFGFRNNHSHLMVLRKI